MNSLILIYADPETYPPTLNAIDNLANHFEKVFIISRQFYPRKWKYPENIELIYTSSYPSIKELNKISILKKTIDYFKYYRTFKKICKKFKPKLILVYDDIPLLTCRIFYFFRKKRATLWYHNHDITDFNDVRKFSIQWIAGKYAPGMLKKADIFTIPSIERLEFFKGIKLKATPIHIPNYPTKKFFSKFDLPKHELKNPEKIKMLYQGSISESHGIEEIMPLLGTEIEGKKLTLTLIGWIQDKYKDSLYKKAKENHVEEYFNIAPGIPYPELPSFTQNHDIGIGIHVPSATCFATNSTASNKLYEYAACGLPILVYETPHYRKYMEKYKWVCFTDLSKESILSSILELMKNYGEYSKAAYNDFKKHDNFEAKFTPAKEYALKKIKNP